MGAWKLVVLASIGQLLAESQTQRGLALNRSAISRNHGMFIRAGETWLYRDLGSTNGSWVDGKQLKGDEVGIIREGSLIQIADIVLRSRLVSSPTAGLATQSTLSERTIFVFQAGELIKEFRVPEYGRALVIGGSEGDLSLEGDLFELPSVVIERQGDSITAFRMAKEISAYFNDEPFMDTQQLRDRDAIRIGNYLILYSDPAQGEFSSEAQPQDDFSLRDWNDDSKGKEDAAHYNRPTSRPSTAIPFGQPVMEEDATIEETLAMDPHELERRLSRHDVHPSMRFSGSQQEDFNFSSLEDKLIIGLGFLLFLVLMGVVVWWMVL